MGWKTGEGQTETQGSDKVLGSTWRLDDVAYIRLSDDMEGVAYKLSGRVETFKKIG